MEVPELEIYDEFMKDDLLGLEDRITRLPVIKFESVPSIFEKKVELNKESSKFQGNVS